MYPWNALYAYCCNVSHGRPMMAWNGLRNMLIQSLSQYMQRSKDEFPFYHRAPFFFLHQLFRQLSFFIWDGHYILCKKLIPVKFWLKNFQKYYQWLCLELIDFELIELYATLSKMTNVTQEEKLEWREHFDEVIFGTV